MTMEMGGPLDDGGIAPAADPLGLFRDWLAEAEKSEPNDANAMALATADAGGAPNVRMVLLKGVDSGFVFYSNAESAKGGELAANPRAALNFHWKSLRKAVRVQGTIAEVSAAEADAYFATRPKDSQIGAWASPQSRPMEGRWVFEKAIAANMRWKFGLGKVPRPPHWTRLAGYAGAHRILARPPLPPARPAGLCPGERKRAVDHGTAVSVSAADTGDLMRRAAIASLSVSLILVSIKTFAYFASHSVAMLASMADSALDLFTSSLNLFAIRTALTPADKEHRFGHGKAEPLAGLAQAAFIAASALFLVIQAVQRILDPQQVENSGQALAVMAISIALALGLVVYQGSVVKKTGSLAVHADATHYVADLVTNVGVVVAIVLAAYLHWELADPIIAIAVAAIMLWSAQGVGRVSLDQLMDHELPEADRARIGRIVMAHHAVKSLHELKTRAAGLSTFIQVHIEMDPDMRLSEAHAVSDGVEKAILNAYPNAEVIIHQDPYGLERGGFEPPVGHSP